MFASGSRVYYASDYPELSQRNRNDLSEKH